MITRIRYAKVDTSLVSVPLNSAEEQLVATINSDGSFFITSLKDGRVVLNQTTTTSIPKAKKLVKQALKVNGVQFKDEVRPRI